MGIALCLAWASAASAGVTLVGPAATIAIGPGAATPYPSTITVAPYTGYVTGVSVQLHGFTHTWPADVDVMLVGPTGTSVLLMSDVGGGSPVTGANLTFTDGAPVLTSATITTGRYRPTNQAGDADTFPAPAPFPPYGTDLSPFIGLDPSGTWSLYVADNFPSADNGEITGGWSLIIETATWADTGYLAVARSRHTASLLRDGRVLVAGGTRSGTILQSCELYDPVTGVWTPAADLPGPRSGHVALTLRDGRVLVVGGISSGAVGSELQTAALYDPVAGTWSATGSMAATRVGATATLLDDGRVLVVGGAAGNPQVARATAEIFNPATGTWSGAAAMSVARTSHTATLLQSGRVLAAGGGISSAEVYNPGTNTWSATGAMTAARRSHTATLLPNGFVLVAAGEGVNDATAELFNPAGAGTWAPTGGLNVRRSQPQATLLPGGRVLLTGGLNSGAFGVAVTETYENGVWRRGGSSGARSAHTTTLLPSGRVLVVGGTDSATPNIGKATLGDVGHTWWTPAGTMSSLRRDGRATLLDTGETLFVGGWDGSVVPSGVAELHAGSSWTTTGALATPRYGHTLTLLPNGRALVTGGTDGSVPLSSVELYNRATGTWSAGASMSVARRDATATVLPSGKVLVAGGSATASAALFDPALGTWASTGAMVAVRSGHTATLLRDGRVLAAGGWNGGSLSSAEIYDPLTNAWLPAASFGPPRGNHTATLLPDGRVLMVGGLQTAGAYTTGALTSVLSYDADADQWTAMPNLGYERGEHAAVLLLDGRVLVVGGRDNALVNYFPRPQVEIYDPLTNSWSQVGPPLSAPKMPTATLLPSGEVLVTLGTSGMPATTQRFTTENISARRPVICTPGPSCLSGQVTYGTPLVFTGTRFAGDSEAASGHTTSSPSNQPHVRLRSVESGRMTALAFTADVSSTPNTVTVSALPSDLETGWHFLTVSASGVTSEARIVSVACNVAITQNPQSQLSVVLGTSATFSVQAQGARSYQWQVLGSGAPGFTNIAGATSSSYTTPPITAAESGAQYRVLVTGGCETDTSTAALLRVADSTPPSATVVSPSGGEYWLLSQAGQPPNQRIVTWSMSDNVRICRVEARLLYSNDAGTNYLAVPAPVNFAPAQPLGTAVFGPGGTCTAAQQVGVTSLSYVVPATPPSGTAGSLYKVEVRVVDHAGLATVARSTNPFYIVQGNPDSVRTLILVNAPRMQARMGISPAQSQNLLNKLNELSAHPRVQGFIVDLSGVTSLSALFTAWDADLSNSDKANAVLFGCHAPFPTGCAAVERDGVQDTVRALLGIYTGVEYLVIVGDDRIVPLARMADRTVLLPESSYVAPGNPDLTATGTTVGRALAANKYLSDDPLAVRDTVRSDELSGALYIPDLSVGRLVETPEEIITTVATFISQDGVLDLSTLDPVTGHKVLVTGYDFLVDAAKSVRRRWKPALGQNTPDDSLSPVDGSLVGATWGLPTPAARATALRAHLGGNGGARYGVMNLDGHANHHAEGVPGTDPFDIAGLNAVDIAGADACATPNAGALTLAGSVAYALGCHGGLPVAGSCATDADRSLDLPQAFLSRGVVSYVANTGYGWGLKSGIGYGERLSELMTEELTSGGTVPFGRAVTTSKQRYFLETPRFDSYDEKSLMQWTVFGLPMYAVKTGIAPGAVPDKAETAPAEALAALRTVRKAGPVSIEETAAPAKDALPAYLTQLSLRFDFSAPGVYTKRNSEGDDASVVPALANPGCPDPNGCYYTLNGLVERSTGAGDLPIQPYFIYDSRLSGTSQHGVLWKGGTYREEAGWKPVIGELVSNGGNGSNHGSTPREILIRPSPLRVMPGNDPTQCRTSDLELNTLVVPAGEALKLQVSDPEFSLERTYRDIELEAFYFNNTADSTANCDRSGPLLGVEPYHVSGGNTITWSIPASDASGVWRVVVVTSDGLVDSQGNGRWVPLELASDGNGNWVGSRSFIGTSRITYVVQAVDNKGNVTWLEYQATELPSSGVPPGIADTIDVGLTLVANTPPSITAGAAVTRQRGTLASAATVATVGDAETTPGNLAVNTSSVPTGITVAGLTNTAGTVTALVGAGCSAALGPNSVGLSVSDGMASTGASFSVNVTANTAPTLGTYATSSLLVGSSATVSPTAPPADNGTVALTVGAPTFTGTLSVDGMGVVSVGNANAGTHTVTVTATDACGLSVQRTFTLRVTGCGGEVILAPDGRAAPAVLPTGTRYFAFLTTPGRSYSVHLAAATGTASPGTVALLSDASACGAASLPGARNTTLLEPVLGNGTRFSFVAGGSLYRLRVTNSGAPASVSMGVAETTLSSASWTTGGTFDTYYAVQNTTSTDVNATLVLIDTAGVVVATQPVVIPAGRTASLNTVALGAPRDRSGVAQLTHDGPPGAVMGTAAILNFTSTPAYVQPVKFGPLRERR